MNEWPSPPPKNILLKMPNWIGDLVMATPTIADVRKRFPDARITVMCQSNVAPLLKNDPSVNEVYSYKRPSGWIRRLEHSDVIQEIQRNNYDLGILFTHSFSSAWWLWRGGVKNLIGFSGNLRSWMLKKAVPFPAQMKTQHLVLTYKELLKPLGIPISNTPPALYISPEEEHAAKELLSLSGIPKGAIVVGMNPGAAYGSAKCWPPEQFTELSLKLLQHQNLYLLYIGDAPGTPLVDSICDKLPKERVINLAGKTSLRELISIIQCCSVFLTNDSGPMHIASALNIPLVALFGSTDDTRTGPYGTSGIVIHKHVACSPCYKRVCPIDFRCMTQITVNEVYYALLKFIEEKQ